MNVYAAPRKRHSHVDIATNAIGKRYKFYSAFIQTRTLALWEIATEYTKYQRISK